MSTKLATILADFTTNLASAMIVGSTTTTLQSATDDDGIALPAGTYFFTLDGENSSKEHIVCTLSGTSLTAISSVSRQGVETSGAVRSHRIGATVSLTDFGHILFMNNLLRGVTNFDATTPLSYDATASITSANQFATKAYVDSVAISGAPDASTTTKGIVKMSVAPVSSTSPIAVGDNDSRVLQNTYVTAGGSANVITTTLTTAPAAYVAGQVFNFKAASTNTSTATLNVNGLGAKNIFKAGVALSGGEIVSGQIVEVVYDGTQFQLFTQGSVPSGTVAMFAATSAPGGWLNCDSSAVSRATFAALFAAIGTTFGAGDGSTTFNVPDLRSRMPIGIGTGTKIFTFASRASNTVTVTTPANSINNELQNGTPVLYTAASPMTGLTTATTYYIIRIAYNQFQLASTAANAMADTPVPIALSSDGSGSQTFTVTFSSRSLADTGGEETHNNSVSETSLHTHVEQRFNSGSATNIAQQAGANNASPTSWGPSTLTPTDATAQPANIMSPFLAINYIIKT